MACSSCNKRDVQLYESKRVGAGVLFCGAECRDKWIGTPAHIGPLFAVPTASSPYTLQLLTPGLLASSSIISFDDLMTMANEYPSVLYDNAWWVRAVAQAQTRVASFQSVQLFLQFIRYAMIEQHEQPSGALWFTPSDELLAHIINVLRVNLIDQSWMRYKNRQGNPEAVSPEKRQALSDEASRVAVYLAERARVTKTAQAMSGYGGIHHQPNPLLEPIPTQRYTYSDFAELMTMGTLNPAVLYDVAWWEAAVKSASFYSLRWTSLDSFLRLIRYAIFEDHMVVSPAAEQMIVGTTAQQMVASTKPMRFVPSSDLAARIVKMLEEHILQPKERQHQVYGHGYSTIPATQFPSVAIQEQLQAAALEIYTALAARFGVK